MTFDIIDLIKIIKEIKEKYLESQDDFEEM
jgi:hypothetical protein